MSPPELNTFSALSHARHKVKSIHHTLSQSGFTGIAVPSLSFSSPSSSPSTPVSLSTYSSPFPSLFPPFFLPLFFLLPFFFPFAPPPTLTPLGPSSMSSSLSTILYHSQAC